MTKFIFISISMLILNKKWDKFVVIIPILFMMSIMLMYNNGISNKMSMWFSINNFNSTLISLSMWIILLMIMSSRNQILQMKKKENLFMMMMLWLMMSLIIAFSSNNLFLFYIFFEMSIIPTMILIIMWGYQPERLQATMYMTMYTVVASLPLLMMFILYTKNNLTSSINIINLTNNMIKFKMMIMFIPLTMAFLVKSPMFFIHLWLPKAHVEAPMSGSMILAAILLKLGGYGMYISMKMIQFSMMNKMLVIIAMFGGVMACFMCMNQIDMKSMVAYSSINHMSLMIAGMSMMYSISWKMSLMIMIAHGLSSSGLFMLTGIMFEKTNSRSMFISKNMLMIAPSMSLMWFLMLMTNMSAPPSINLLSEIFLMNSMIMFSYSMMMISLIMITVTGIYNLYIFTTLNHGNKTNYNKSMMNKMESYNMNNYLHLIPTILLITSPFMLT